MNRYLDENGNWVRAIKKRPQAEEKKPVKHSNPVAQKHNEKAIEENKSKDPIEEEKPKVEKGFSIKKKAKKKSE